MGCLLFRKLLMVTDVTEVTDVFIKVTRTYVRRRTQEDLRNPLLPSVTNMR